MVTLSELKIPNRKVPDFTPEERARLQKSRMETFLFYNPFFFQIQDPHLGRKNQAAVVLLQRSGPDFRKLLDIIMRNIGMESALWR